MSSIFKQAGFALFGLSLSFTSVALADEGMFPLSELSKLDLKSAGINLTPDEIFNPAGISVVDGICRVNGCTGSFLSSDGLLITNHHCAFDAIQKASTSQNDYLKNGFVSKTRADEIPAPGYTVRITESYRDVSKEVLTAVTEEMSFLERSKAIEKRRKELEKEAESASPGLRAEVAEMFTGKTYVLFLYTYLKDIRLVFAPPVGIGEFGGDFDNWEWPRHTGDFSFMRAYTSPDGSSADYSPENVPYKPKQFLRVQPKGANEGDAVFILGYPGRTLRQRTASYFEYEQTVRLPKLVELYSWQMQEMTLAGEKDRQVAIKHATRYKSLANVEKRSRGQLLGLKRTTIIDDKHRMETELQKFIDADPARKQRYSTVLKSIADVYKPQLIQGPGEITLQEFRQGFRALSFAMTLYESALERAKPDLEREAPYMERNWLLTKQQLKLSVGDWHPDTDKKLLIGFVQRLRDLPSGSLPVEVTDWLKQLTTNQTELQSIVDKTSVGKWETVETNLDRSAEELQKSNDPVLKMAIELYPVFLKQRELDKERSGELNRLYGELLDVKQLQNPDRFVPDANATLRITYGRIKGYSPADAIYKQPVSTVKGILEKSTGTEPFATPQALLDTYQRKDFDRYLHPVLNDVPVAILYNTDTTGGNSGSPVLNGEGELIGVNFDRTFEATINDFAWNESYSRSIGVDIRYVLWVTGKVYGAQNTIQEILRESR
ncbi:MAG: S46 family peptidase [Pirellula sp.]|jgi:hypothetical protein|nr:S46 family peptidase [Pirellula sp.]